MQDDGTGGVRFYRSETPVSVAKEIEQVGALASPQDLPVGHVMPLCGQTFVITGEITRKQFIAMASALHPDRLWSLAPADLRFYTVSTD